MSVYNDMASDAGYKYGSSENQQMAAMIEAEEERNCQQREYERAQESALQEESGAEPNSQTTAPACNGESQVEELPF